MFCPHSGRDIDTLLYSFMRYVSTLFKLIKVQKSLGNEGVIIQFHEVCIYSKLSESQANWPMVPSYDIRYVTLISLDVSHTKWKLLPLHYPGIIDRLFI